MNLLSKIKFHSFKLARMGWYQLRYRLNEWKYIQGIFIPVKLGYGYNVLRFIDNGAYEQHEIALVKQHLKENDRVLELGTGIGFVSAYCAKIVGSEKVYSFEGNPSMEPIIRELYRKNNVNPNLSIAMLGEGEGEKSFYVDDKSFLASSVTKIDAENVQLVKEQKLNEAIAAIRPSYLVMDIEGGEYDIFKMIDFQTICKVQFELHPNLLTAKQVAYIFEKLAAANFIQVGEGHSTNNFFFRKHQPSGSN